MALPLPEHVDVLVVGAGPVGALAALKLAEAGRQVALIEARPEGAPVRDARALALSWASRAALADAGVWRDDLGATAIDTVHVSQQGGWGRTVLSRDDLGLPHLGVVVDYPSLFATLAARLAEAALPIAWGTRVAAVDPLSAYARVTLQGDDGERVVTARLVVLAEGGELVDGLPGLTRRVHDYGQAALLAEVASELPHRGVAYERFSKRGPLALLPRGDGFMLVWTRTPEDARELRDGDPAELERQLAEAMGERLGAFRVAGSRALFPLTLKQASRRVARRVALIGNAAQTLHPVAAQGLNLGIRDALALAAALAGAADAGDAAALSAYERARALDSGAVVGFTHQLVRFFDGHGPLLSAARGLGMNLLDAAPALRRRFAGHLVFGVGGASLDGMV
ncbi:FAD-dependent oxidoreductase [Crenobacter luteus]|uniref:2-octaprenyl-6-methoxyphenyl hydroxylase n=1 Tax=Crenobacter luteus TaxID=1452487 RepID=A0A163D580_9NEIS|nr:FAD-dependent oxidoreductase [Crenobacter luteus]KZE33886.1 2-octaprenyl-6-methoxyphenyl hydroxylase [Crenobacter luteus]